MAEMTPAWCQSHASYMIFLLSDSTIMRGRSKERDLRGNWSRGVENGQDEILEEGWRLDEGKRLMNTHMTFCGLNRKVKGNIHRRTYANM